MIFHLNYISIGEKFKSRNEIIHIYENNYRSRANINQLVIYNFYRLGFTL